MFRRKPRPSADRWLVIGLGNPGREYAGSRHNMGFLSVDELSRRHRATVSHRESKSLTGAIRIGSSELVLAKPQTMMNRSGDAVKALRAKYGVPLDRLLVVHDELDLPFGRLRVRRGGSSAGHHGLDSVIAALGTPDFIRFRVGVDRPTGDGIDYVLGPFTPAEREALPQIIDRVCQAIASTIEHGLDRTMTDFNKG